MTAFIGSSSDPPRQGAASAEQESEPVAPDVWAFLAKPRALRDIEVGEVPIEAA